MDQFLHSVVHDYGYNDIRPYPLYKALASTEYKKYLDSMSRTFAFMEISIGGTAKGKLVFEVVWYHSPAYFDSRLISISLYFQLFTDICPRTCAAFISHCAGRWESIPNHTNTTNNNNNKDNDDDNENNNRATSVSYKGSLIHRVVKEGWIQGGDIVPYHISGSSNSKSIIPNDLSSLPEFGATFPDENFIVKHSKPGILVIDWR